MSKKRVRKASWHNIVPKKEYVREWVDGRQYCLVRIRVDKSGLYNNAYIPFGAGTVSVPKELIGKRVELVLRVSKR